MLTLILCTAAATVSLLSAPLAYLAWVLYGAALLHAAAAAFEARHTPARAAFDQLVRCLATLAAPTVSATAPFVHFSTLGAVLFREDPLSPATLALSAQAALLCACLAKAGVDAIQNARAQAQAARRKAPGGKVLAEDDPDPAHLLSRIDDLTLRMNRLERQLQRQSSRPARAASTDTPDRTGTSRAGSQHGTQTCLRESPFDAAVAALAEMGYHDGPWNAHKTVDTPADPAPDRDTPDGETLDCEALAEDSYPPVTDDADFLKVMERP